MERFARFEAELIDGKPRCRFVVYRVDSAGGQHWCTCSAWHEGIESAAAWLKGAHPELAVLWLPHITREGRS